MTLVKLTDAQYSAIVVVPGLIFPGGSPELDEVNAAIGMKGGPRRLRVDASAYNIPRMIRQLDGLAKAYQARYAKSRTRDDWGAANAIENLAEIVTRALEKIAGGSRG